MAWVFRTLICAAEDQELATTIAATLGPKGSQGMFQTPLGVGDTVTHYASSGYIDEGWSIMAPCATWEQGEEGEWVQTSYYPGNPEAVVATCAEAGLTVSLEDLVAVFARADASEQEPFVAFGRLGIHIIDPAD